MFSIDAINTLAFAGVVLFLGYAIRGRVPLLARLNIPAPVIGGLLVSALITVATRAAPCRSRSTRRCSAADDRVLHDASGSARASALLRVGGPLVLLFFVVATVFAVLQNVLGAAVACALGQPPLLGVLAARSR